MNFVKQFFVKMFFFKENKICWTDHIVVNLKEMARSLARSQLRIRSRQSVAKTLKATSNACENRWILHGARKNHLFVSCKFSHRLAQRLSRSSTRQSVNWSDEFECRYWADNPANDLNDLSGQFIPRCCYSFFANVETKRDFSFGVFGHAEDGNVSHV